MTDDESQKAVDGSSLRYFLEHFHERASLADDVHRRGFSVDANILAATALDALGEIWLHDFPGERAEMEREFEGKVPPSIRMARLVRTFAIGAPHVGKIAVVLFAEDWKKNIPEAKSLADALLAPRVPQMRGELPHSHLDTTKEQLSLECPAVATDPLLALLAEEYEYPALFYRFVRSPAVHFGTNSPRTHGFVRNEEIFYMSGIGRTTIGIGIAAATAWLRMAATGYVNRCSERAVRPATGMQAASQAEDLLAKKWAKARARMGSSG